ncbi:MAG: VanW family protein [Defluviitaleaceae bacterium]|nr:VanW family protein [Defluviitaleaceae bacterium]
MYAYKAILLIPAAICALAGCNMIKTPEPPPNTTITETPARQLPPRSAPRPPKPAPAPAAPAQRPKHQTPQPAAQPALAAETRQKTERSLATHQTEFDAAQKNRATNISRAAETINGKTVQPGETFSYNETVGPTIEKRGYKKDIIFVDGEKKEGVGGGVCQVSTTLFNAAESAGLEILERHDHSRPVTYAPTGKDAATSYGGIDFKFKNNKLFPIKIIATADNGKITVSLNQA